MSYKRVELSGGDLEKQRLIMQRAAERNAALPKKPVAFVDTYGCQQNEADSEKLRGMLSEMGYDISNSEEGADVIVVNTCAVREHAELRVLGNIGAYSHVKEKNPNAVIAVCGCMVQQQSMSEKLRRSYRQVDLVFGPHVLWRFPEFLERLKNGEKRIFETPQSDGVITEGLPSDRDSSIKAWLSIMYGCNNFCSYCIVPYVRGRERSRSPEEVLKEAEHLVRSGYKDITLLGQNVNSYGKDLSSKTDFSDLLKMINDIDGDFLIRFMTSHPKDAGDKLFKTMAECEKVAHHLHLPFQSGNDRILKAMNRVYTRQEYLALIEKARETMPDIVLTSDVIVGFPGETDEEFSDTMSLVEKVGFDALFTFIYSKRGGTPAANMPDPVTAREKQRRFDALLALQNSISEKKHKTYIGTRQRVLIDGLSGNDEYPLTSRTNGGRLVRLKGDISLIGSFAEAEITGSNTWALSGFITEGRNI